MIVSFFITIYNMDMDQKLALFQIISKLFENHGFHLYLVGGTVRDYLLSLPLTDMDAVTDATPDQMKIFLNDADYTFAKYGSVRYVFEGVKFDITTLREEGDYSDARHPQKVQFVKNLSSDVKRRDFTINGLYLNSGFEVIDLVDGKQDLINHFLRTIGPADQRIKEDPLRIIRAIRFALDFDLSFDESLLKAMKENIKLIDSLNPEKVKQDIKKMKCDDNDKIMKFLSKYNFTHLLDVIK